MSKINYIHTEEIHNTKAAEEVLPYIFSVIKPVSVIDFGCGTGSWLAVAKMLGAQVIQGIDGIYPDQQMACIETTEFKQHDLTLPIQLNTKYDLAICLEVLEHLPESAADNLIDILTRHSDIILFSAAIPGQGGQFHINEKWPEYWQRKFANKGYSAFDILRDKFWNNENVEWWYRQNMLIYAKHNTENLLGIKASDNSIMSRIHPELFKFQIERTEYYKQSQENYMRIIQDRIWNPKFLPTLKLLIKSMVKWKIVS